jgi:hypothetical protein
MGIKKLLGTSIIREAKAVLTFEEDGQLKPHDVTVRFHSWSEKEAIERGKALEEKAQQGDVFLYEILADKIDSIVDGDGEVLKADAELLSKLDRVNLFALQKAIQEAISPK